MLVAAASTAIVAAALPAGAHVAPSERENNRYLLMAPLGDRLRLAYTIYFGQVPGRQARARMDADRDGALSDAEAQPFGERLAAEVAPHLSLEIDGQPVAVTWQEVDVGLGQPVTDAGAFAVDLVAWVCLQRTDCRRPDCKESGGSPVGTLPRTDCRGPACEASGGSPVATLDAPRERAAHRVRLRDRFHVPDPGESELRAEESPGVRITRSEMGGAEGAPPTSVRLDFRWMGRRGPIETDGYRLDFEVDPALAVFTGGPCGGERAPATTRAPLAWLATGAAVILGLAALLWSRRRARPGRPKAND